MTPPPLQPASQLPADLDRVSKEPHSSPRSRYSSCRPYLQHCRPARAICGPVYLEVPVVSATPERAPHHARCNPEAHLAPRYPKTGRRSHTLQVHSVTGQTPKCRYIGQTPASVGSCCLLRSSGSLWTPTALGHHRNLYLPSVLTVSDPGALILEP